MKREISEQEYLNEKRFCGDFAQYYQNHQFVALF
jgi:hypothetical protein